MKAKVIFSLCTSMLLLGCSSTEYDPVAAAKEQSEIVEIKNELIETNLKTIPSWALDPPKSDNSGMFAVGIGSSESLELAMKKASLEAEFGLAKLYSQELSGSERLFSKGGRTIDSSLYIGLIDKIVDAVPVVGYSTEEKEVRALGGRYQAFILLKLPYDEFNAVLNMQREQQTQAEMREAFGELEQRLKERRRQIGGDSP